MEAAAVLEDVFSAIPFGKAEIENFFAVPMADAAGARAEAVDEPGELGERDNLQDAQAVLLQFDPIGRRARGSGCSRNALFANVFMEATTLPV